MDEQDIKTNTGRLRTAMIGRDEKSMSVIMVNLLEGFLINQNRIATALETMASAVEPSNHGYSFGCVRTKEQ